MTLLPRKEIIPWLVLAVAVLAVNLWNQWSNNLADPDAFYHMKMAQLIWQQGLVRSFIWLPYTTLAQHYVDQHVLLHIIMIPAVAWKLDPFVGEKVLTAILGMATIMTVAYTIKRLRWFGALPLAAILAATVPFYFRLQLVKATPLALILLCLAIICLVEQRRWWLVVVSYIYVWAYGGFAMVLAVCGLWSATLLLTGQWRKSWWPLVASTLGCVLGVVINPYFPGNLQFYWEQFVQIGIVNYRDVIPVGGEWYPYNISQLWLGSVLILLTVVVAVSVKVWQRTRWQQLDWFALGLAVAGLALTLKSRRYVEYWAPFTILACAIWLRTVVVSKAALWGFLESHWRPIMSGTVVTTFVLMTIVPMILQDVYQNNRDSTSGIATNYYRASSTWLHNNSPAHSVIVHSDWDDFPELFYYNDQGVYMAGLDPTFMYRADPNLYYTWANLTTGTYQGNVSEALKLLKADYAFIEHDHTAMEQLIKKSGVATKVYQDAEATIYQIKNK